MSPPWAWPCAGEEIEVQVKERNGSICWVPAVVQQVLIDVAFQARVHSMNDPFEGWFKPEEEGKGWRRGSLNSRHVTSAPALPHDKKGRHSNREIPMTASEALATARREGLLLPTGPGKSGYAGVCFDPRGHRNPYSTARLGSFNTAEEAALGLARLAREARRELDDRVPLEHPEYPGVRIVSASMGWPSARSTFTPEPASDPPLIIRFDATAVSTDTIEAEAEQRVRLKIAVRLMKIEMKIAAAKRLEDADLVAKLKQQLIDL